MNFSAVVLTGGNSRRMGREKSWIQVEGEPLLERQIKLARSIGAAEVFISGRPGVDYSRYNCRVLLDAYPERGPLAGIERGVAAANTGLVLALAVDLPFLQPNLLTRILAQCTEQCGAVPRVGDQLECLAGFYPKAAHKPAVHFLEWGNYAVHQFASACEKQGLVKFMVLPAGAARQFTNWNCPEDVGKKAYFKTRLSPSLRVTPSRSSFSKRGTAIRRLAPIT